MFSSSSHVSNSELTRLIDEHTNVNFTDYASKNARADFNRYEMRDSINVKEVIKRVGHSRESHIEITFKKELAQLLDFNQLESNIRDDLYDRNIIGKFTTTVNANGDAIMRYEGLGYRGSKPYMECAIPFFVEKQHERMMKQNPRAFPLFHARMEMNKLLEETEGLDKQNVLKEKFYHYKQTMIDLMHVLAVLKSNKVSGLSCYPNSEAGKKAIEVFDEKFVASDTPIRTRIVFENLLLQFHRQSKEMLISKKGAVIGGLMMAFGALMVAAGVALGFTLGWTGIGLGVGVGLSVAGAGLFAGGVVAIKEREHFSKIGRRMNDFYNTHKLYKDEIDKPAQPAADNTVRMCK